MFKTVFIHHSIGGEYFEGDIVVDVRHQDDSFDHAFGTEERDSIEIINIESADNLRVFDGNLKETDFDLDMVGIELIEIAESLID